MSYTACLFLPAMHERYLYLTEVLLLIAAVEDLLLSPCALAINVSSLLTYGTFLFKAPAPSYALLGAVGLANLLALLTISTLGAASRSSRRPRNLPHPD